ncbi:27827_t:CDS:2 [Dentiscutata erythropus]|uniref:27827_t:CDS:1 n=1 Tax=Dentiscutata erythropus TaxID=1348616 RepID=A0A9N9ICM6_9GLOM|nr:27827_t:CDS:2 [Dentiscutata erythropus]
MPPRQLCKNNTRNSHILKIQNKKHRELFELFKEYRRRINAQAQESELKKSKLKNTKIENSKKAQFEKAIETVIWFCQVM